MASHNTDHYWGIVDMGSNGIRFSISDLSPMTARIMPTIYQDRAGISLYDAQWRSGQKEPIPEPTMLAVVQTLRRFKRTCRQFGVADARVRVLATEATRQAVNSEAYRARIKEATGWQVEMLPKEEEGRVGAMGVASSFETVRGLMMDLGGGSTQITWLIAERGKIRMSEAGSVSMPYGAAALMRRLTEANKAGGQALDQLRNEITTSLRDAVAKIDLPEELKREIDTPAGLTLYLSGGGFRGWGFVLMSQHKVKPYPIPIINGFKTSTAEFQNTQLVTTSATDGDNIFRVSERRAGQLPAVALLIGCLETVLPAIKSVRFAQGGVREGSLFAGLDDETRAKHPMETATKRYASPSSEGLAKLLLSSIPEISTSSSNHSNEAGSISKYVLRGLAYSLYIHNILSKDVQAASALRSTTTGALASVHGADHEERAELAIMLCERWGGIGALSPGDASFYQQLVTLLGDERAWWALYYGRVAAILGEMYPAGVIDEDIVSMKVSWKDGLAEKETTTLKVSLGVEEDGETVAGAEGLMKAFKQLSKLGKKKNWPRETAGYKLHLEVKSKAGDVDLEKGGDA